MIISPQLSVVIPIDELRYKLKNKHIKVNIRKKTINRKIKIKKKLLIILKKIIIKMR